MLLIEKKAHTKKGNPQMQASNQFKGFVNLPIELLHLEKGI